MMATLAPGERMKGGEIVGESGLAGQQVAPLIPALTLAHRNTVCQWVTESYWGTEQCEHPRHWNQTNPGGSRVDAAW